jgi:hypothetical protein
VADRARENRSQLVFTTGRGREMVFWQSPRTVKQARPNVALPTARAGGLADLEIIVDTRERYAYRFTGQAVTTVSRALNCGDYGVVADGRLVAAVERKSLSDLVSSVTNGKLRYALGDLAALPRAAVVVEDRYSALFKAAPRPPGRGRRRPGRVPDSLADHPDRLLRDPLPGRGMDLPLPRRRLAMGHHRTGRPSPHGNDRSAAAHRPRRARPDRRRSPRLGPPRRPRRPRPRPPPPRDLDRLADRALTADTGHTALLAKVARHPAAT